MNATGTPAALQHGQSAVDRAGATACCPGRLGCTASGPGCSTRSNRTPQPLRSPPSGSKRVPKATLTTLLAAGDKRVRVFDSLWSTFTQFPRALPLTMYSGKLSGLRIASATLLVLNEGSARVAAAAVHSCRGAPPPGGYSTSCTSMPRSDSVSLYVETKRPAWPASALTLSLFLHISPRVG